MFVIRSQQTGLFLARFPVYDNSPKGPESKPGAVWWNDKDLQSFAWVESVPEARKASQPADVLGLVAGLTLDPHTITICQVEGDEVTPLGTLAELLSRGIVECSY